MPLAILSLYIYLAEGLPFSRLTWICTGQVTLIALALVRDRSRILRRTLEPNSCMPPFRVSTCPDRHLFVI